jgi:hypothetical protein
VRLTEPSQRYVSKELSHFVGRGHPEQTQYQLLLRILRSGWLTYSPDKPNEALGEILIHPDAKISENELYNPGTVCFCDIPVQDLAIHVRKYSPFGLAFSKDFVTKKGGSPIYYLPREARVRTPKRLSPERISQLAEKNLNLGSTSINLENEDWEVTTKAEYFNKMLQTYQKVLPLFSQLINKTSTCRDPKENLRYHYDLTDLRLFLDFHVFSYVKFFDHALLDAHPENYYFEREWRIVGSLRFHIDDIIRVVIPKKYAKQFRKNCPDYFGQITFVDA